MGTVIVQERRWRAPEQFGLWSVMKSGASLAQTRKCLAGTHYRWPPALAHSQAPTHLFALGYQVETWLRAEPGLGLFPEAGTAGLGHQAQKQGPGEH